MPYQMENGKWRAKKMISGKVKTRVFSTKKEAKRWEAAQSREEWERRDAIPTISLLDFCTAYLKEVEERCVKRTFNEKLNTCRRVLAVLAPDRPVESISMADAMSALRNVAREYGGNAANKCRKNMSAAWEGANACMGCQL